MRRLPACRSGFLRPAGDEVDPLDVIEHQIGSEDAVNILFRVFSPADQEKRSFLHGMDANLSGDQQLLPDILQDYGNEEIEDICIDEDFAGVRRADLHNIEDQHGAERVGRDDQ